MKIVNPLFTIFNAIRGSANFEATPASNRKPSKGKNTEIPYVEPAIRDEWLLHEKTGIKELANAEGRANFSSDKEGIFQKIVSEI